MYGIHHGGSSMTYATDWSAGRNWSSSPIGKEILAYKGQDIHAEIHHAQYIEFDWTQAWSRVQHDCCRIQPKVSLHSHGTCNEQFGNNVNVRVGN